MDGLSAVLRLKIDCKIQQKNENKSNKSIHKFKKSFSNVTLKSNNRSISRSTL